MAKQVTCDEYYTSCGCRGKEDDSKEYGRTHKYFRHFCIVGGIYDGKLCPHAMIGGSRLVPRYNKRKSPPVVKVYKVEPAYRDLIKHGEIERNGKLQ